MWFLPSRTLHTRVMREQVFTQQLKRKTRYNGLFQVYGKMKVLILYGENTLISEHYPGQHRLLG